MRDKRYRSRDAPEVAKEAEAKKHKKEQTGGRSYGKIGKSDPD